MAQELRYAKERFVAWQGFDPLCQAALHRARVAEEDLHPVRGLTHLCVHADAFRGRVVLRLPVQRVYVTVVAKV